MSRVAEEPLPPERFEALLHRRAPAFGLSFDPPVLASLSRYLSELDRWRRRTNLVGDLTPEELADHALESALGAELIAQGATVIDIGSGAGFPGVPLSIGRADLGVTFVESRAKRAAFLRHVIRELGLRKAHVFEGRIERVGGHTFDAATTRAVGSLAHWIGKGPFLRPAGELLVWTTKPEELGSELASRFSLEKTIPIPGSRRRAIAVYRKV
ncbi:MAG TPA: 16S rRNA (guanine(527)-N(7))-methyltransferase RsmG [Thermoanaerobaculia bacterium]|jgi:16S rRNA (guanine527-N7)-methyltransferase